MSLFAAAEPTPPLPAPPPWLGLLNPAQRQAVETVAGPVLVLAGAGTGKTRVLVTRLAYILHTRQAWPSQILAVTFTNKAAREMTQRVAALIGQAAEGMWLGTFHHIGARILRRHAELVGLKPNFTILDTDDQIRLLKQVIAAENIDDKKWPARAFLARIQQWKDKGLTVAAVAALGPHEKHGFADGRAPAVYRLYQERLHTLNTCDFGDLLLHNLTLFKARPEILADYRRRFRYILVDEYQDSNVAQYQWLRLLAEPAHNICCVGDDDQSIYGWRGAEVGNILRFEKDFPGARIVRLERNYRSTGHILGAASGLIAHNEGRLGKTLWTEIEAGEKVAVRGVWDGDEEARLIGDEIEALQRHKHALNDIAILVRAGFQTRAFEERFISLGLRYRIVGGLRFYERQEIRDAIAYLRMVAQPDDGLAFERIMNVPKRGLGDVTLQALHALARARQCSLPAAARVLIETDELKPQARATVRRLLADFDRWRGLVDAMPHAELAQVVLDESGYTAMWQADRSADAPGRLENLKELVRALGEFASLGEFLEHVSLVMENDRSEAADMVNMMTLHAAKGLEFETVFLPGWEEGVFPNQRTMDEGGAAAIEEERRLAHVGITRAKRRCAISFAANRRTYAKWEVQAPSRFIDELPAAHIERQGAPPPNTGLSDVNHGTFAYAAPWLARERHGAGARKREGRLVDGSVNRMAAAASAASSADPASGFRAGQRVFHEKFGYGRVLTVEDNKLSIAFDKAGEKKVIDAFVQRA